MRYCSVIIFVVIVCFGSSYASMQNSFDDAFTLPLNRGEDVVNSDALKNKDADVSHLTSLHETEVAGHGMHALKNSEFGQMVKAAEQTKENAIREHDINNNNPIIKNAENIALDPLKHIDGSNYASSEVVTKFKVKKQCREGTEFELDVIRQLVLETSLVETLGAWQPSINFSAPIYEVNNFLSSKGFVAHPQCDPFKFRELLCDYISLQTGKRRDSLPYNKPLTAQSMFTDTEHVLACRAFDVLYFEQPQFQAWYKYRKVTKEFKELNEYWEVVTTASKELLNSNECYEEKRICLDAGPKVFYEQYTVKRPCWREQISYRCKSEPKKGCEPLKQCILLNCNCIRKIGGVCLEWLKDYECTEEKRELRSSIAGSNIFCMDGNCFKPPSNKNDDFQNVGYLATLNEMKKDMAIEPIMIFKGTLSRCRHYLKSFINCCSSFEGWGKDMGLARCSNDEKCLAKQREKELCHEVGTYCERKFAGECIEEKTSYCCFGSKIARIIHEQGRMQIGKSWGDKKYADCSGFTLEELARLDFDKIDFTEIFAEIFDNMPPNTTKELKFDVTGKMPKAQENNSEY